MSGPSNTSLANMFIKADDITHHLKNQHTDTGSLLKKLKLNHKGNYQLHCLSSTTDYKTFLTFQKRVKLQEIEKALRMFHNGITLLLIEILSSRVSPKEIKLNPCSKEFLILKNLFSQADDKFALSLLSQRKFQDLKQYLSIYLYTSSVNSEKIVETMKKIFSKTISSYSVEEYLGHIQAKSGTTLMMALLFKRIIENLGLNMSIFHSNLLEPVQTLYRNGDQLGLFFIEIGVEKDYVLGFGYHKHYLVDSIVRINDSKVKLSSSTRNLRPKRSRKKPKRRKNILTDKVKGLEIRVSGLGKRLHKLNKFSKLKPGVKRRSVGNINKRLATSNPNLNLDMSWRKKHKTNLESFPNTVRSGYIHQQSSFVIPKTCQVQKSIRKRENSSSFSQLRRLMGNKIKKPNYISKLKSIPYNGGSSSQRLKVNDSRNKNIIRKKKTKISTKAHSHLISEFSETAEPETSVNGNESLQVGNLNFEKPTGYEIASTQECNSFENPRSFHSGSLFSPEHKANSQQVFDQLQMGLSKSKPKSIWSARTSFFDQVKELTQTMSLNSTDFQNKLLAKPQLSLTKKSNKILRKSDQSSKPKLNFNQMKHRTPKKNLHPKKKVKIKPQTQSIEVKHPKSHDKRRNRLKKKLQFFSEISSSYQRSESIPSNYGNHFYSLLQSSEKEPYPKIPNTFDFSRRNNSLKYVAPAYYTMGYPNLGISSRNISNFGPPLNF